MLLILLMFVWGFLSTSTGAALQSALYAGLNNDNKGLSIYNKNVLFECVSFYFSFRQTRSPASNSKNWQSKYSYVEPLVVFMLMFSV